VRIDKVELREVSVPLKGAFRTSFGTDLDHNVVLVRVVSGDVEGWAECVAGEDPAYSSEYTAGAVDVMVRYLIPALAQLDRAEDFADAVKWIKGHRMAKAAIETAFLDAQLKAAGTSFASYLGAERTDVITGVSVGIMNSIPELIDAVRGYLDEGYARIKLKIEPGWDVDPVRAVRQEFGDILLQVDANTAYSRNDGAHLAKLDEFNLLLIEQPLDEEDVPGHALLAKQVSTPICLDESIVDTRAAIDAIESGACAIVNIKPGRVGGYLEGKRIHDACVERSIPVWCGGMLELGIGRAPNLALAALPGFTLPGDTSASSRYYAQDITTPFVLQDGHIAVPNGPGIGVSPDMDILDGVTVSTTWVPVG